MKNSEETFKELQQNFQRLKEENKHLRLKARSIDVLNNLLENSQDENKQLKEHILELQSKEEHAESFEEPSDNQEQISSGVDDDSTCRVLSESSVESSLEQNHSTTEVLSLTREPPPDVPQSIPEDIKVFQEHVQSFQTENIYLSEEVEKLLMLFDGQEMKDEDGEIMATLSQLRAKLQKFYKETSTRKSFIHILASEKKTLESKISEAISDQGEVVNKLKSELEDNKELLKDIKRALRHEDEVSFDISRSSSLSSCSPGLEAQKESYVMVPKQDSVQDDIKETSDDVKDASPMHSVENPTSDPLTSGYVVVQQLQEKVQTITREKEELLNVNHQWDQQYRRVQMEKNREISTLQEELFRARQENEAIRIRQEERQNEFDRKWTQAQEMLEREKEAKETYLQQKESIEARMHRLEISLQQVQTQYREEKHRNENLEENINQLTRAMKEWTPLPSLNVGQQSQEHHAYQAYHEQQYQQTSLPQVSVMPSAPTLPINRPPAFGAVSPPAEVAGQEEQCTPSKGDRLVQGVTVEEIEMLKQQVNVYAEDFRTERADRERIQTEKETMKEEVQALKENLTALQQQVRIYEDDFKREKADKEKLQRQLRGIQGIPPPEYHPAPRVTMEQVKEQQRILQEMIDRYHRSPRYNPAYPRGTSYQDANRQWMQARGPTQNTDLLRASRRNYDDMFHGGDVVPDTEMDVKDGDSDHEPSIKCPHCDLQFKATQMSHLLDHVQGCRP